MIRVGIRFFLTLIFTSDVAILICHTAFFSIHLFGQKFLLFFILVSYTLHAWVYFLALG